MTYVKPFLAWQAYQFWLPKANFKTHASGLRVHEEDNSRAATDAEMANLIRDAKMWAQTKKDKLVQFLRMRIVRVTRFTLVPIVGQLRKQEQDFI